MLVSYFLPLLAFAHAVRAEMMCSPEDVNQLIYQIRKFNYDLGVYAAYGNLRYNPMWYKESADALMATYTSLNQQQADLNRQLDVCFPPLSPEVTGSLIDTLLVYVGQVGAIKRVGRAIEQAQYPQNYQGGGQYAPPNTGYYPTQPTGPPPPFTPPAPPATATLATTDSFGQWSFDTISVPTSAPAPPDASGAAPASTMYQLDAWADYEAYPSVIPLGYHDRTNNTQYAVDADVLKAGSFNDFSSGDSSSAAPSAAGDDTGNGSTDPPGDESSAPAAGPTAAKHKGIVGTTEGLIGSSIHYIGRIFHHNKEVSENKVLNLTLKKVQTLYDVHA